MGFSTHTQQPTATTAEAPQHFEQGSTFLGNNQSAGFAPQTTEAFSGTAAGAEPGTTPRSGLSSSTGFDQPVSSPTGSSQAVPTTTEGFGHVTQDQQYPMSTQASQGSIDTYAGTEVAAVSARGQFGGQRAFDRTAGTNDHARGMSQDLAGSAAGLVQADEAVADFSSGTDATTGSFAVEASPVTIAEPLTSVPPSASWGAAPSTPAPEVDAVPTPHEPAVHAVPEFESQRSQPQSDVAVASGFSTATELPAEQQSVYQDSKVDQTQHDAFGASGTETDHAQQQQSDDNFDDRAQKLPDVPSFSEGISDLPSEGQGGQGTPSYSSTTQMPMSSEAGFYQGNSEVPSHGPAFRPLHRQLSAQAESLLRQSSTMTGESCAQRICTLQTVTVLIHAPLLR